MTGLAVEWLASEPMTWFKVVLLDMKYGTSHDVVRRDGYPFTFDQFTEIVI